MAGEDLRDILFLCALQNAVKYGGVPQAGAVVGMVMSAHPEFRPRQRKLHLCNKKRLQSCSTSSETVLHSFQARAPEMYDAIYAKHEQRGKFCRSRICRTWRGHAVCPNPSGPLHIGHARAAVLNDVYVKQYGGRYILRIEDTDRNVLILKPTRW